MQTKKVIYKNSKIKNRILTYVEDSLEQDQIKYKIGSCKFFNLKDSVYSHE